MPSRNGEVVAILGVVAFLVYSWSILQLLYELPAWLLYLSTWSLISDIAYVLAFALLESLLVVFALFILARILPERLFRAHLVPQATLMVTVSTVFAITLHYSDNILRQWGFGVVGLLAVLWVVLAAAGVVLVYKSGKVRSVLASIGGRLGVFSYLYVPLSIISLVIVFLRNLVLS